MIAKTLYGTDFAECSAQTAELLRQRKFDEIEIENVAGEIRSLGDSQFEAARAQPRRRLMHLIKLKIQPERDGAGWRASIVNAPREMLDAIESPPSLRRRLAGRLERTDPQAIEDAFEETGLDAREIPAKCPFTLNPLLESNSTLLRF